MSKAPARLWQTMHCDCGCSFKFNAFGADTDTDVICPTCHEVFNPPQSLLDQIFDQYSDAIGNMTDDDDMYEHLVNQLVEAPAVAVAEIAPIN